MQVANCDNNNEERESDDVNEASASSTKLFDEMTKAMFSDGGRLPRNPFASGLNKINKGDLYDKGELMAVLNVHNKLTGQEEDKGRDNSEHIFSPTSSLHDLVMQAVDDEPSTTLNGNIHTVQVKQPTALTTKFEVDDDTKDKILNIRAIASDVDGTLLSKRQTIHPITRQAVKKAISMTSLNKENKKQGLQFFFPATGKSRKGALDSLGIEIGSLIAEGNVPGVYLQGLYCVDGSGAVIFEQKLTAEATKAAESVALQHGVSVVGFDGDNLYTTDQTDIVIHLHEHYGEPLPQLLLSDGEGVRALADHQERMHKLLIMDNNLEKLSIVRPQLEAMAEEYGACVTQALPTMLEWLPLGCSKALGVSKVCEALGIDPEKELLSLGDAENDAGMLKMSAIGVAMGNGCPIAQEAADFVMEETNDDGGAGVAMELFGFGNR